jgi:hypothetical protein
MIKNSAAPYLTCHAEYYQGLMKIFHNYGPLKVGSVTALSLVPESLAIASPTPAAYMAKTPEYPMIHIMHMCLIPEEKEQRPNNLLSALILFFKPVVPSKVFDR